MRSHTREFIEEAREILASIDVDQVEKVAQLIAQVRERGGRVFFCGSGGGAAHASHAACDFRKSAGVEAYSPSDNVAELTALVNDEGWAVAYSSWLAGSHLNSNDCLFILSVGGGDVAKNVSPNLVSAMKLADKVGAPITGIAGRDGGALKEFSDSCIIVPTVNPDHITAHTESMQAVLWHLLATHPALSRHTPKWESMDQGIPDPSRH